MRIADFPSTALVVLWPLFIPHSAIRNPQSNVVGAEAVKNVDGVDDDGLERVFALGEFGADLQKLGLDSTAAVIYSPACSSRIDACAATSHEKDTGRMPKQDVPKRIKKLRAAMGLTQEQFAAAVGVTYATVNRWENGNANPQPLALRRIEEMEREVESAKKKPGGKRREER
jgi:putative transcriptional regulator